MSLVTWHWKSDTAWVPYSTAQSLLFEAAYQRGDAEARADSQRFVDIPNMLQRRYDDRKKRRGVERRPTKCFSGAVVLLGTLPDAGDGDDEEEEVQKNREYYAVQLAAGDALVTDQWHSKVDTVVVSDPPQPSDVDVMKKAAAAGVPVVSFGWLDQCIAKGKQLATAGYEVEAAAAAEEEEQEQEAAKKSKKRKATTTKTKKKAALKKSKSEAEDEIIPDADDDDVATPPLSPEYDLEEPKREATAVLDPNASALFEEHTEWLGSATHPQYDPYAMVLSVTQVDSAGKWSGQVFWPTLRAVTSVRGTAKGSQVEWTEWQIISGEEEVEVGTQYAGVLGGNSIKGKMKDASGVEGTFELLFLKKLSAPPVPATLLASGAKLQGVAYAPYPFEMSVTKSSGTLLQGTIQWTTLDAKTEWKGSIKPGGIIDFKEEKLLKGDEVEVPSVYSGYVGEFFGSGKVTSNDGSVGSWVLRFE